MSPTISDDDARPPAYAPSAPPMDDGMDEEIPVVKATAVPMSSATSVPLAMSTSVPPPATAPNASVPAGMVAKSVTTTYADGRQVTVTEYQQPGASSSTGANPAAAAASSATAAIVAPRRNLGARPVNIACPYCNQTAKTRINHNCGDCTIISVIVLLFFCFPFFWIPFICPSCQDVEHHCGNCGRLVGKSRAECCS